MPVHVVNIYIHERIEGPIIGLDVLFAHEAKVLLSDGNAQL